MKVLYLICLLLCCSAVVLAQPANDDCTMATELPAEREFCSGSAAFLNVDATPAEDPNTYPICIDEREEMRDVWFTFEALENSVTITVTGATAPNPGGTLRAPQFALLEGSCDGGFTTLGCRSPFENPNGIILNGGSLTVTGLEIGETYYILVGARFGNDGSFELCVDQFEAVPSPSGDCGTGVILCDKSPFAVDFLEGNGQVADDILSNNVMCGGGNPQEQNSAWYKWTCDESGTLSFTIDPLGAAFNEDIDFVVFELTNGLDDCSGRQVLRQMFSGETTGNGDGNIPCLGETGLSDAAGDVQENCGCTPGDNNFLRSIDMVSGRSYAVVIMNFTGSRDGFAIEFGGTGTFLGPEPEFTFSQSEVCVGESLVFEDQSQSVDEIVSREWDFGPTASPQFASGPGPHSVVFGEAGTPAVELVITTSRECREVLNQQEVNVICCSDQFSGAGTATDVICPNDSTGTISFSATSSFSPTTVAYLWSNGAETANIDELGQGTYTVTVSDASGCEATYDFTVGGPPAFTFDTLITMPSCAGGVDGALEFTVTGGGEGPYEYSFNGGAFGANNRITDIPVTTVNVRARDANGCPIEQDIFVDELQLGLVQGAEVFTEPVCAGDANGSIEIQLANGAPTFRYDFGLGGGFQTSNVQGGLSAGVYTVTAIDADGCTGVFPVELTEPPAITLETEGTGSTCFGTDDGQIIVLSGGGRPGYTYAWSDGSVSDTIRTDLAPGTYTVSLTDQNGCVRATPTTLTQPAEIFPVLEETTDLTCFGEPAGSFLLSATGGTPDYTYATDDRMFQLDPLLDGLAAGDYTLYVMDANGCVDSLTGTLTQPREFIVDPGPDARIFLGFDTLLRAVSNYNPVVFSWQAGLDTLDCINADCSVVRAGPTATTDYLVIGTNPAGCLDTATLKVEVIRDLPLYIPNAFSPNGDGTNDGFTVFGGRAVEAVESLRIYHRWGGLIFENTNFAPNEPSLGWNGEAENGKPLNPGVFVYSAAVRFRDGTVAEYAGDVTLLR